MILPCPYHVPILIQYCPNNIPIMSHNAPHLYSIDSPYILHYSHIILHLLCSSYVYLCSYSEHILFSRAHPWISFWYHYDTSIVFDSFLYHVGEFCWIFAEVFKMQCCEDAVTRCIRIDLELWEWDWVGVCCVGLIFFLLAFGMQIAIYVSFNLPSMYV